MLLQGVPGEALGQTQEDVPAHGRGQREDAEGPGDGGRLRGEEGPSEHHRCRCCLVVLWEAILNTSVVTLA